MGRLDVGGFIEGLERDNAIRAKCKTCGRDKRLKGRVLPTTEVKQRCPECKEPLVWVKTSPSGEREEHEWQIEQGKEVVRKDKKRINITIN